DVYNSYFDALVLGEWNKNSVILKAKNSYSADLITERYGKPIGEVWCKYCGPVDSIEVEGASTPIQSYIKAPDPSSSASSMSANGLNLAKASPFRREGSKGKPDDASAQAAFHPAPSFREEKDNPFFPVEEDRQRDAHIPECVGSGTLNHAMSLDRYCVNETNQLVRHAVTRLLDTGSGPITYLYGGNGRGKSHLLNATAMEWLRRRPNDKLMYLTYDSLVADVSDAFISNSQKDLRRFLQDTDVLVFDDVHMLRGRKRTQEELACLIERLHQADKPVLVAGASSPSELAETGISERLADRLAGGVSVGIEAPNYELRLRVASQMADAFLARTGFSMAQRHLDLIARRCDTSIRELEGMIRNFELAMDARQGMAFTDDEVRRMISDRLMGRREGTSIDELFNFTAEVFGLSRADMQGKSRQQAIVRARQAFCLVARKKTEASLTAIGAMVSRDHTTVMHSVKKAEIIAGTDASFGDKISHIFDEFDRG
ncbi:MAG: DnaA/Hda family protein, partial [Pseudomonadota bacterium]